MLTRPKLSKAFTNHVVCLWLSTSNSAYWRSVAVCSTSPKYPSPPTQPEWRTQPPLVMVEAWRVNYHLGAF